jgi:oligosaccharide repeat unit polymerase
MDGEATRLARFEGTIRLEMSTARQTLTLRMLGKPAPLELALAAISALITLDVVAHPAWALWAIAVAAVGTAVIVLRFDYLNPLMAFLLPWVGINLFAGMGISRFARPLSGKTHAILLAVLVVAVGAHFFARGSRPAEGITREKCRVNHAGFWGLVVFFAAFSIFNVVLAGYVPLIRGIQTGSTDYLEFGIHGVFGLYNAFANALAVFSFFLYLKRGEKRYLWLYAAILCVFGLFVTRQNIISAIVESLIVYCFVRGKIRFRSLALGAALLLVLFALAGNWRSGDIRKIAGVREEYTWIPDPVIWVYGYSYFTVLNLDNVISNPKFSAFDGSSLFGLMPSFLRPKVSYADQTRELSQFTVYSYIAPIYADIGIAGVLVFTLAVCWWGARSYQRAREERSFYSIAKYSVLFYCALFSFFVNYWLYLPIIAQIPILKAFSKDLLEPESRG